MVRMARFSSDDPGWVDPDDRLSQRLEADDTEWDDLNPQPRVPRRRKARKRAPADERLQQRLNPQCDSASQPTPLAPPPPPRTDGGRHSSKIESEIGDSEI
jgi:hypothetical protein